MDVCKSVSARRQMKRWRNDVDQPETAGRGREKGGRQYCNVPGGKINRQLIDVSVGVRL